MKNSLIILGFFVIGVFVGVKGLLPDAFLHRDMSLYALYLLLFLVGVVVGADPRTWYILKNIKIRILFVPVSIVLGTLAGVALASFFVPAFSLRESLAVGSGFGYYSLSSVIITRFSGETLGVVGLLSNIIRELFTLLTTPLLARYFGPLAPIACGGATAMDTTLPVITRFSGHDYAMIAVFSGFILTLLVPLIIPFLLY